MIDDPEDTKPEVSGRAEQSLCPETKPETLLLLNFLQFILLIKLSTMADFSCECTKVFVGCLSGLQLLVPLHTHPTQKVFEEHTRYFSVHFIGLGQA